MAPLKARVARFFARLQPPKKGLEGFIQSVYHDLQDMAMHVLRPRVCSLPLLHLAQLLHLPHRALLVLPRLLALCEAIVIEATTRFKRGIKQPLLGAGGIEPVAKGFALHWLESLLGGDVALHGFIRDVPDRRGKVGARPK